jgi:AraC family transcriptional activator FtrA
MEKAVGAAGSVARPRVIPPPREGGHRQFIDSPVQRSREAAFSRLFDAVRGGLSERWTLSAMAAYCGMSERTFCRRFAAATALSPGVWLVQERVAVAKALLEDGAADLAAIAERCGFGSQDNFSKRFKAETGVTPAAYRRAFGTRAAAG